ncbi:hypothetical protein B0I35DRAFT_429471 [Stachybotrys elegans]|uniref:Uncharacterized protein n=1 Tax=Stachybotrys elegans TaxID=80388 RepID=A0A8K0SSH9_9HYPO|nr:hypothetical protein B0I35DRAFT_429471 [Stachybotrys elegans]
MVRAEEPRRRFAPIPIETTFASVRKGSQYPNPMGPNPELTPEPSPRSPSPVPAELRERRRFAPQLIETSRRTRRVGDEGPATKPTDKTDITPYTKHIYATRFKSRRKHNDSTDDHKRPSPPTRRETEDEDVKEYLLELAAKEAERQIQEAALAAFPNSHAREGGIAHFYFRESSESDHSPEATSPQEPSTGQVQSKLRRKSSDLGLSWWHKHMQEHAENLPSNERADDAMVVDEPITRTDSDLDRMDLALPPDPMWTTTRRMPSDDRRDSINIPHLYTKPLLHGDDSPGRDVSMTDAPTSAPQGSAITEAQKQPQEGSAKPFGAFGLKVNEQTAEQMRKTASPPMLGKELVFRRCPSPKLTKLEPEHDYFQYHIEERARDVTGQAGLWRGYCYKSESTEGYVVPSHLQGPAMLATPLPPATPHEALINIDAHFISEEPSSVFTPSDSSDGTGSVAIVEHRDRNGEPRGVHMLHGLEDRLRREKAQAERDEKIAHEFDEIFVTQVYNYLSLGYPATARAYDEELSKISHVSIEELRRDDELQMANGHILEMDMSQLSKADTCPRWRALRIYVLEWARQHPNLDNLDPQAWGVRERRGSWAI